MRRSSRPERRLTFFTSNLFFPSVDASAPALEAFALAGAAGGASVISVSAMSRRVVSCLLLRCAVVVECVKAVVMVVAGGGGCPVGGLSGCCLRRHQDGRRSNTVR